METHLTKLTTWPLTKDSNQVFRIKLKKVQKTNNRIPKYNLEKLKEEGENQKYIESLTEKLKKTGKLPGQTGYQLNL